MSSGFSPLGLRGRERGKQGREAKRTDVASASVASRNVISFDTFRLIAILSFMLISFNRFSETAEITVKKGDFRRFLL